MTHNARDVRECAMDALAFALSVLTDDPSFLLPSYDGACSLQRNGYGVWYFHITLKLESGLRFAGGCHVRDAHGRVTPLRATICFPGHDRLVGLPTWLARDAAEQFHEFEFHLRGDGISCARVAPKTTI